MIDGYNEALTNDSGTTDTMILYHFLNAEYGLEAIKNRRLKISRIMGLNDPFEFLGVDLSDKKNRKAVKELKEYYSEKTGIVCFSKTWKNPVLWGHYADKHKGICLGFEVPEDTANQINYVNSRFPFPKQQCDLNMEFMEKDFIQ